MIAATPLHAARTLPAAPQPQVEQVEAASELRRRGLIFGLVGVALVVILLLLLLDNGPNAKPQPGPPPPVSP
jgi:hypothetical protein